MWVRLNQLKLKKKKKENNSMTRWVQIKPKSRTGISDRFEVSLSTMCMDHECVLYREENSGFSFSYRLLCYSGGMF